MNEFAKRIIMDRARNDSRSGGSDYARGQGGRRDNTRTGVNRDGRRGVRGTGRYGIGGSMYSGRDRRGNGGRAYDDYRSRDYDDYDYEEDYADYDDEDYERDYHEKLRLSKSDIREWKSKMQNADGSLGEHFDLQQIMSAAERLGIRFNDYSEKELCITANMLYSDYCEALKAVVPKEKEDLVYTKLAKAFLEDDDAPEGSEKLALYYHCIVCDDEE